MRARHDVVAADVVDRLDDEAAWIIFGVRRDDVPAWRAEHVGPFEAALAQVDGFTPSIVGPFRRQLHRVACTWAHQGLDSPEGVRWHQAGFAAGASRRWCSRGVDIATATVFRGGGERGPTRRDVGARLRHGARVTRRDLRATREPARNRGDQ